VPKVDPVRQAVDLDRLAVTLRGLDHGLDVDRVWRPATDVAARRVAYARDVRVLERARRAGGELVAHLPLAAVDRGLHPAEPGEHVVGEVELSVRANVALDPGEDAEGREPLVRGGDLLGLPANVVGAEPRHRSNGGGVIADGQVLVAELARRQPHLVDALASVRPRRVAVQVAPDLGDRDRRGRFGPARLPPQLGWEARDPERGVNGVFVRAFRQRLQRVHVRLRAGGPQELGAEALARRDNELHGHAFDGHAGRAVFVPLEHDHDLR